MARQLIVQNQFNGGIAEASEKIGRENSARFIKQMDIFEDPAYVVPAKATTKISSTTVTDLVTWIVDASPFNTNRYAYDLSGKIYQINSSDTVSSIRTVSGGAGEGLYVWDNALFYAQATELGRYFPLDNSPSFDDAAANWIPFTTDLTDSGGGTGQTYSTTTSINEGATHRQTFEATQDPVKSITIDVNTVGTGDWTVTLHRDSNDDVIGTATISNGSVTTGDNVFTLSSVGRVNIGENYHFHVTTTVADGAVTSNVASDLEGAEYTITYGTLIDSDWHPMTEHLNQLCIGNERYLATFSADDGTYDPNRLTFAAGHKARTLAKVDEYVVIGTWKGQNFQEAEEFKLYFWDGISSTFNYVTDGTIGAVNALHEYRNSLVGVYGNKGSMYAGNNPFEEIIDKLPKMQRDHYIEVYPGGMTVYEDRLLVGAAGATDDGTDFEQGIYEFGSQLDGLPNVLNYPYVISTGTTQSTTVKIGSIAAFGEDLYIGWRDASTYGIDKVKIGDNAATSGSWESRIFDGGDPNEDMQALKVEITFEALASGESVTPKYKLDRASSFTTGDTVSTTGETRAQVYINTRCKEIEFGFNVASSSNTYPKITSVKYYYDDMSEEGEA